MKMKKLLSECLALSIVSCGCGSFVANAATISPGSPGTVPVSGTVTAADYSITIPDSISFTYDKASKTFQDTTFDVTPVQKTDAVNAVYFKINAADPTVGYQIVNESDSSATFNYTIEGCTGTSSSVYTTAFRPEDFMNPTTKTFNATSSGTALTVAGKYSGTLTFEDYFE